MAPPTREERPPASPFDRASWLALGFFALLAIAATYPVAWHLTERVAGDGADSHLFLWNHWWFAEAVSDGRNPYVTDAIYWPGGTTLFLHTLSPFHAVLSLGLAPWLGLVGAYNVLVIASFAAAAWAAYLLARDLTGSHPVSVVAGTAFGFTAYHYAHALGHLNLIAYFWLPLFALFFLRHLRGGGTRDAVLAAAMFVGAGLTDLSLLLNLAIVAPLLALGVLGWQGRAWLRRTVAPAGMAAVALSPLIALVVWGYATTPGLGGFGDESPRYSLDALSYAVPTPLSSMYAGVGRVLTPEGTSTEASVFAGLVLLGLAAVGVARGARSVTRPWLVAGGAFYVLSLGPVLQVGGVRLGIPLPYALFAHVPLLDTLRTPARFALVVLLAVALLGAVGLVHVLARLRARRATAPWQPRVLVGALVLVVLAEGALLPFPTSEVESSPIYEEALALAPSAIVELPLRQDGYDGYVQNLRYLSAQTEHGVPIVNGYTSRETVRDTQFLRGQTVLSQLARLELGGLPPEHADVFPEQDTRAVAGDLLDAWGLRALVLHFSSPPTATELREYAYVAALPGVAEVARAEDAVLFHAQPTDNRSTLLLDTGTGWHGLEATDGTPFRWTFQQPQLRVDAQRAGAANLTLAAQPFLTWQIPERHVDVVVNGARVAEWTLGGGWQNLTATFPLVEGENLVELRSRELAVSPLRLGLADDPRPLALAVRDVRVTLN